MTELERLIREHVALKRVRGSDSSVAPKCPKCSAPKAFFYQHARDFFHCFSCGLSGNNAVAFRRGLMRVA